MTSATTIILVLYFIQGSLGHGTSPEVGVVGGHAVDIELAPFMAAVLHIFHYKNVTDVWCGGSIIHEQFVLTAATCCNNGNVIVRVRVGSTRYDEGGELHEIEKYITHESFNTRVLNNVALLKLSKPVTFGPSVAAIKLADASVNIPVGLTVNITGWGYPGQSWVASRDLQQASVTVSPQDECSFGGKLTDKQLCVDNGATSIGACNRDDGGPLTARDLQIGIYSYGTMCWGIPNVYEKVAPHLQWIRNKIKQNL